MAASTFNVRSLSVRPDLIELLRMRSTLLFGYKRLKKDLCRIPDEQARAA